MEEETDILKISVLLFCLLTLLLPSSVIPNAFAPEIAEISSISASTPFCLRGDTLSFTVTGSSNAAYSLQVYDPLETLVRNVSRNLDSNGVDNISFNVPQSYASGTYTIVARNDYGKATTWLSLVETTGYKAQPFPYTREHMNVTYRIAARGFQATCNSGNISLEYPSLPVSFTVTSFANNMSFVERLKNTALGISIDLSYLFIWKGMKILINGTLNAPATYTFKCSSPKALLRKLDSIRNGFLVFDWGDVRKAGQAFSYNSVDNTLTVSIPKTFRIDPVLFQDGFESGFTPWDGTTTIGNGAIVIGTDQYHHGSQSVKATWTNSTALGYCYENFGDNNLVYARCYFRLDAFPVTDTQMIAFLKIIDSNSGTMVFMVGVRRLGASCVWRIVYRASSAETWVNDADLPPTIDAWREVKVLCDMSTVDGQADGMYALYIDGTQIWNVTNKDTDSVTVDVIRQGLVYVSDESPNALWIDCVTVSTIDISSEAAPVIGEFQAPSTVYANQDFFLNATVRSTTDAGATDLLNATIQITGNVILKWDNATNVFSEYSDPSSYCTINAAASARVTVNSSSYQLCWYIKLNNYPTGLVDVVAANTKAFDALGTSGSGSQVGLFTFSYISLTLQARDATGANLPRQLSFKGTYGNSTSFDLTSSSTGSYTVSTCYGSHTINTWWSTHLVQSTTQSITSATTVNIDTKIRRLDSGSNYILFSLNNTNLLIPQLVGSYDWRIESIPMTADAQFKADNANWLKPTQPYSFTVDSTSYTSGTGTFSWSSGIFTFTVTQAAARTLSMTWDSPGSEGGSSGGTSGGYLPPIPTVAPLIEPLPIVPPEVVESISSLPPLGTWGIALLILSVFGAILYGEVQYRKPSVRRAWQSQAKAKRVRFPKEKRKQVKWKSPKLFD